MPFQVHLAREPKRFQTGLIRMLISGENLGTRLFYIVKVESLFHTHTCKISSNILHLKHVMFLDALVVAGHLEVVDPAQYGAGDLVGAVIFSAEI